MYCYLDKSRVLISIKITAGIIKSQLTKKVSIKQINAIIEFIITGMFRLDFDFLDKDFILEIEFIGEFTDYWSVSLLT